MNAQLMESIRLARRGVRVGTWPLIQRYVVAPKVLELPPAEFPRSTAFCVHTRLCERDVLSCHWMLRSLHRVGADKFSVVLHDDGSLSERSIGQLARSFPGVRIISRDESRARVGKRLADWPDVKQWHARDFTAVKWLDPYILGESEQVVFVDTDVLFFEEPIELSLRAETAVWQEDQSYMLHISPDEAEQRFGTHGLPAVNSGIGRVKRAVFSEAFAVEMYRLLFDPVRLADCHARGLPRNDDQTFHALLTACHGGLALLPKSYLLTWERGLCGAIAKHYVGSYRFLLWEEGIPRVARQLGLPLAAWMRERP